MSSWTGSNLTVVENVSPWQNANSSTGSAAGRTSVSSTFWETSLLHRNTTHEIEFIGTDRTAHAVHLTFQPPQTDKGIYWGADVVMCLYYNFSYLSFPLYDLYFVKRTRTPINVNTLAFKSREIYEWGGGRFILSHCRVMVCVCLCAPRSPVNISYTDTEKTSR